MLTRWTVVLSIPSRAAIARCNSPYSFASLSTSGNRPDEAHTETTSSTTRRKASTVCEGLLSLHATAILAAGASSFSGL